MSRRRSSLLSAPLLGTLALVAAGCGAPPVGEGALLGDEPFVAIPRSVGHTVGALRQGLDTADVPFELGDSSETFYLAINRKELGQRWFLSAFLKQYFPGAVSGGAARSLCSRVVSFRVQNGRLFVFDVDNRKISSDTFNPDVIVEAWPIVDYAPFKALAGAERYLLIDPSAGLNRFGVVGDAAIPYATPLAKLTVELSYLQRFRRLGDGVTFEQIVIGAPEVADPRNVIPEEPNPKRAAATLGVGLRRYVEGMSYKPTDLPYREHYFRGPTRLLPNEGKTKQVAAKWAIYPGMKPIRWLISNQFLDVNKANPDYDIVAAVKAGVEGWNQVFGFPALEAVVAAPGDSFADDDVNYLVFDKDPSYGAAYANWRLNPNTGEIRGATVYFNGSWVSGAISRFSDDAAPLQPRPRPTAYSLTWEPLPESRLCLMWAPGFAEAQGDRTEPAPGPGPQSELTKREKVERYVSHVIAHEIGHTLGLRHNFKGSLQPPSNTVMEYISDDDRAATPGPGAYDVEAVRYLYGLAPKAPALPFCTDEETSYDVDCMRFDRATDPLNGYHAPAYAQVVADYLEGRSGAQPNNTLNNVLKYVRSASSPTVRLHAFRLAMERLRVPVSAAKVAAFKDYAAAVDNTARRVFLRLFLDPNYLRGDFTADPPTSDDPLMLAMIAEAKANLQNLDTVRSFATRRVVVDVLKKIQRQEAYEALLDARGKIAATRPNLAGSDLALTDDLLARIDAATRPYFTN